MKKIYIILAVMAAAALASCTREQVSISGMDEFGPNTIAFSIADAPGTRAGDVLSVNTINLGELPSGEGLYLQDVVTVLGNDLEALPQTKGVPVTDENVASLHGRRGFGAYLLKTDGSYLLNGEKVFEYQESSNKWTHEFETNPLPADNTPVFFLMWMPSQTHPSYSLDNGNITYTTTIPAVSGTGIKDQTDWLLAGVTLTRESYEPARGFDVTFYHPYVGIRFKLGNRTFGTTPSEISLNGIVSKGSCVLNPVNGTTTWTLSEDPSDVVSYSFTPPTAQEQTNALDDGTGEYTFWIIPQMLSDNATLTVKVQTEESQVQTLSVNLKEALGTAANLKAGQLHTFTISPNFIEIKVEKDPGDNHTVTITNVGNIDAYIRAAVIENWLAGRPENHTYYVPGDGNFEGIPTEDRPTEGWTYNSSDGYYYTTEKIKPGESAKALYTKYTPGADIPVDTQARRIIWALDVLAQGVADNSVWQ